MASDSVKRLVIPAGKQGLVAFWDLAKVVAPLYLGIALLDYTGVVTAFARWLSPVMAIFRLPGEAAVPLLTGWFITLYGALGAMKALGLKSAAMTTLGLMLLICHVIPMEWAVLRKMGARAGRITLMRIAVSVLAGVACGLISGGQGAVAHAQHHAAVAAHALAPSAFAVKSLLGCAKLLGIVLAVIVPVTVISEWMRARELLPRIARRLAFLPQRLGVGEGALVPLLIGLIFGIMYGAGALIGLARSGAVKPGDARFVGLFLALCHSLLEDPALFIAAGGNWLWLLPGRILIAFLLTPLLRRWA